MEPVEYDVFICCREKAGGALARLVASSLTARGFRVALEPPPRDPRTRDRRLALIGQTPDFVVVLAPGDEAILEGAGDPMRQEIAHALRTERIIVPVYAPGMAPLRAGSLPLDLTRLRRYEGIAFETATEREDLARLAHTLSSETTIEDRRQMRFAKWAFAIAGLAIVTVFAVKLAIAIPKWLARPAALRPLPPMALYWSAWNQRADGGRWVDVPLQDGATVRAGDRIRLAFSPSSDGFAYALGRDARGDVSVLYPGMTLRGAAGVRAGQVYEAPPHNTWFTVDPQAGLQVVYLLASYDPIENLEELVEESGQTLSPKVRLELLTSTIAGLLDGKHGMLERVRARSGRPILRTLPIASGPQAASATLAGGSTASHTLALQPGFVSALVEINVLYERAK
jgi:hypothetical protein